MTPSRWSFSLRAIFSAMTLVGCLVAMTFNHPGVAVIALAVTSPFLFVATMAFVSNHSPFLARWAPLLAISLAVLLVAFLALLLMGAG